MYKIIGADHKEYGPVPTDTLKQWIAQGRVNGQTKVLAEGATEWCALSEIPALAAELPIVPPPPIIGALLCCIGLFFTVPLGFAFAMSCYEKMFSLPAPAAPPTQ